MSLVTSAQLLLIEAASKVSLNPDMNALPGGPAAQKIVNGIAGFGLLFAVAAFAVGGIQWAWGTRNNNYAQAEDGKGRMLKSVGGAFAVGAAAAAINFFYTAGSGVK